MTDYKGLRHFKNGISCVSQWTGREHKEMEHVIVAVFAGIVNTKALKAVCAAVDFIYYAQYQRHTDITLAKMQDALDVFHLHKDVFAELHPGESFNIPKLHSMLHYINSIRSLGTADGYNTESPERLHIDFAKEAYRASNTVDYVTQMTKWLQRREAIDHHSAYLDWISMSKSNGMQDSSITTPSGIKPGHAYHLPKTCSFPSIPASCLISVFGAEDFVPVFQGFLNKHKPNSIFSASISDRFDVYKSIMVILPSVPHISDQKQMHKLRACCIIPSHDICKPDTPAHFNTALIVQDQNLHKELGGLHGMCYGHLCERNLTCDLFTGLRVAQICIIFTLPSHYSMFPHQLAYIEWFWPFSTIDETVGMYKVARSTCNRARHSAVIGMNEILQACHLAPKYRSTPVDLSWTYLNVIEKLNKFFLNHYCDFHLFEMLQCDCRN